MTSNLLLNWLKQGPHRTQLISFTANSTLYSAEFISQVCYYFELLSKSNKHNWLLASENSDHFIVGLSAALLAGKAVILPPNIQKGTIDSLTPYFDAALTDELTIENKTSLQFTQVAQTENPLWPSSEALGKIKLFTSGSSGTPKCIDKSVAQLDAEVCTLESTFSDLIANTPVAATVSHQHIYGLLFKLLWPIATGRAFLTPQINYPETLCEYIEQFPHLALVSSPAQLSRLPISLEMLSQKNAPKVIFSSGGPLSKQSATEIEVCYNQLPIEVFGSTETGGIAYRKQQTNSSAWHPFPGIQIGTQETTSALKLKSPYLVNCDWFITEDKVAINKDGSFHLLERLDRIVKIEEKRVSLQQIENHLTAHELVSQAAAIVLTKPKQQLGAVIELSVHGQALLEQQGKLYLNNQLKAHLLNNFERVTLPKRWRYTKQLPLNSQGKRLPEQLTELFVK